MKSFSEFRTLTEDEKENDEKESGIEIDEDEGYGLVNLNVEFGKDAYDRYMKKIDYDEDREKPMVYKYRFGKYSLEFKSTIGAASTWTANYTGFSSKLDSKEQGKFLSTILSAAITFGGSEAPQLSEDDVELISFRLSFDDKSLIKNFKKLYSAMKAHEELEDFKISESERLLSQKIYRITLDKK